jgi:hypothetical protein
VTVLVRVPRTKEAKTGQKSHATYLWILNATNLTRYYNKEYLFFCLGEAKLKAKSIQPGWCQIIFMDRIGSYSLFTLTKKRYNKESEKQAIATCTKNSLQHLQASSSLHPLSSSYNYHVFFYKIPYQDLDVINSEFTKSVKKRKFWWVSARDLLDDNTPLKLYARLGVIKKEIDRVIIEIAKECDATI